MTDPLLDLIARLPQASVAPGDARRIQASCHRVLERRTSGQATRHVRWRGWSHAVIGLGVLYVAEGVRHVLRVYGAR